MKFVVLLVISIVMFILDVSFLFLFGFGNSYSSLLMMCVFIYCINSERHEILLVSLFSGFLQDVFFDDGLGLNMFLNLVTCVVLHMLSVKCNKSNHISRVLIILLIYMSKSIVVIFYMFVTSKISFNFLSLVYEFAHAFLVSLFMYPMFNRFFNSKLFKKVLEF